MSKAYVSLPGRPGDFSKPTIELDPDFWKVELVGRLQVETDGVTQVTVNDKVRTVNNTRLLLVFKDCLSGKMFWWSGSRSHADTLKLSREDKTYNFWPVELFHLTRSNAKEFFYYVLGFACEFKMEEEERMRLNKRKQKFIEAVKAAARSKKQTEE